MNSARLIVLGEQGVQSATSFLANVLVARHYSPDDYAAFSLAVASSIFIGGIQRALIVIPFVVSGHGEHMAAASSAFCRANLRLTAALALPTLALGLILNQLGHTWIANILLGTGLLCAGMLPYELCRRWLLQHKRYTALLAMSASYAAALLTLVFIGARHGLSLWLIFAGMMLSTAAALFFLPAMRRHAPSPMSTLVPPGFRFWNLLSHLAFSGYNYAIQAIQGMNISKADMAAFYATRNLFQPVQVLVMAVDSTDKPRAANAYAVSGRSGLFASLRRTCLTLFAVGAPFLALVYLFHEPALHYLYNGKFDHQSAGCIAWIAMFALMMLTQPIETGIYVIKKSRILFTTRLVAAIAGILCCVWLTRQGGYTGAIISMSIGWLIALIGAFIGLIKASRP
jgi:O-antigen/teichoic acid export membrane protein